MSDLPRPPGECAYNRVQISIIISLWVFRLKDEQVATTQDAEKQADLSATEAKRAAVDANRRQQQLSSQVERLTHELKECDASYRSEDFSLFDGSCLAKLLAIVVKKLSLS